MSRQAAARKQPEPELDEVRGKPAEEYASMCLSIDHLQREPHNGHTVLKNVWSTESASEALLAQIDYFQSSEELKDPGVIDLIAAGNKNAAVFVFIVGPQLTNVIVDAAIWSELLSGEGPLGNTNPDRTVLGAHASLIVMATELTQAAKQQAPRQRILGYISEDA